MKKYKINRTGKENIPSDETIEKFKNFSKLQVRYDEVVKRNKLLCIRIQNVSLY